MFPGKFLYSLISIIAIIDIVWIALADISVVSATAITAFSPCIAFGIAALSVRILRHEKLLAENAGYRALCNGAMTQCGPMFEGLFLSVWHGSLFAASIT